LKGSFNEDAWGAKAQRNWPLGLLSRQAAEFSEYATCKTRRYQQQAERDKPPPGDNWKKPTQHTHEHQQQTDEGQDQPQILMTGSEGGDALVKG